MTSSDLEPLRKAEDAACYMLLGFFQGVLSTQLASGYPLGSVVPYCLDEQGSPLFLLSDLAQHTKNIKANPKVSLTLYSQGRGDIQQQPRLSIYGQVKAISLADKNVERYYRHFPNAHYYCSELDFNFYQLEVLKGYYVGGFGKVYWLGAEMFQKSSKLFSEPEEFALLIKMNDSFSHLIAKLVISKLLASKLIVTTPDTENERVMLVGIDTLGFTIRWLDELHRVSFPTSANLPRDAQQLITTMINEYC
ncbi:HugZ family pyridoxamine 5'-phosphate oxidase [Zooshikella harenae]|uniref:Pyridoxamine 5'-phosphate oxidase family protein n=1 Tax=Zooshikella harenae TaxID=2827238 RepID=A0ABS5ZCJ9_9GAMM|nr:pyridoxamine 5'-phosphate oxidase family protein [Zooshikella harenae]MBU2711740.1 pyridoxamine 5'-phosphate oxidase family protein [Zooshikella harenae]